MPPVNIGQYSQGVSKVTFYGGLVGAYFNGTTATVLANGSGQGMGRLKGMATISVTIPEAAAVSIIGDGGKLPGGFMSPSTDTPSGAAGFVAADDNFAVLANGYKIVTSGNYDQIAITPSCATFNPLVIVVNSFGVSQEAGTAGQSGWTVHEFWNVNAFVQGFAELNGSDPAIVSQWSASLSMFDATTTPWGETITSATWGREQSIGTRYFSPYPVTYHAYRGTGAASQTVTLDETPVAANGTAVQVWGNGTAKAYTTDYTVNTTNKVVTFVTNPAAAEAVVIRYQFEYSC